MSDSSEMTAKYCFLSSPEKNGFVSLVGKGDGPAYLGRTTEADWKNRYKNNDVAKPVWERFLLVTARELPHCIPRFLHLCDRAEVICKRG